MLNYILVNACYYIVVIYHPALNVWQLILIKRFFPLIKSDPRIGIQFIGNAVGTNVRDTISVGGWVFAVQEMI